MSGGSAPTPPSPTASAQAEASAQLAGQMFQAQNAPVLAYEDALSRGLYQPYETQLAANLGAASQFAGNPQAYEGQQMAQAGANSRLAALYGTSPSNYSYGNVAGGLYPSLSMLPNLGTVGQISRAVGSNLGSVSISGGGNVQMMPAQYPQNLNITSGK